jgi:hypothetical protein
MRRRADRWVRFKHVFDGCRVGIIVHGGVDGCRVGIIVHRGVDGW